MPSPEADKPNGQQEQQPRNEVEGENVVFSPAEQQARQRLGKPPPLATPANPDNPALATPQVPKSGEFFLSPTHPSAKEVTKTDLRLLRFYSLLSALFRNLYPPEMATSVAPPIDQEEIEKKVKESYERLVGSPEDGLPVDEKRQATRDFRRVTKKVGEIEATPQETRADLLRKRKYQNEKKYLRNQTLGRLHKLR